MENEDKKRYMQDAHMRYIIDYYSSENGREIGHRKVYLIYRLGLSMVVLIVLLIFLPDFKSIFLGVMGILIYLFGIEIGRREGYVRAYKSLLDYDINYLSRYKELQNSEYKKSNLNHDEADKNVSEVLSRMDFPLKEE